MVTYIVFFAFFEVRLRGNFTQCFTLYCLVSLSIYNELYISVILSFTLLACYFFTLVGLDLNFFY